MDARYKRARSITFGLVFNVDKPVVSDDGSSPNGTFFFFFFSCLSLRLSLCLLTGFGRFRRGPPRPRRGVPSGMPEERTVARARVRRTTMNYVYGKERGKPRSTGLSVTEIDSYYLTQTSRARHRRGTYLRRRSLPRRLDNSFAADVNCAFSRPPPPTRHTRARERRERRLSLKCFPEPAN